MKSEDPFGGTAEVAEISKKAAGSYYSGKLFSDRTRKVLRFLFGLKGRASAPEETDR